MRWGIASHGGGNTRRYLVGVVRGASVCVLLTAPWQQVLAAAPTASGHYPAVVIPVPAKHSAPAASAAANPTLKMNQRAAMLLQAGAFKNALVVARATLGRATMEANAVQRARAITNIGSVHYYVGDYPGAMKFYQRALKIAERVNNADEISRALNNLGDVSSILNDEARSAQYYRRAVAISEANNLDPTDYYINLMSALTEQEKWQELAPVQQRVEALMKRNTSPITSIYYHWLSARTAEKQHALPLAQKHAAQAYTLAIKADFGALAQRIQLTLADIAIAENRLSVARNLIRTLEQSTTEDRNLRTANLLETKVLYFKAVKDYQGAVAALEALADFRSKKAIEQSTQLSAVLFIEREVREKNTEIAGLKRTKKIEQLEFERQRYLGGGLVAALLITALLTSMWLRRRQTQRELERQLKLNQELHSLNQLKDQILMNTSHELRTPLNGIVGLADLMLMDDEANLSDEFRGNLKIIVENGKILADLVSDLLDLAQIRSGHCQLKIEKVSMTRAVNQVTALLQPHAEAKKLGLYVHFSQDIELSVDPQRFRQILINIVGNAVKFTEQGAVVIDARVIGTEVEIAISDSGSGIAAEDREQIFDSFKQLDGSLHRDYQGSGLGLPISRELARLHGGDIRVEPSSTGGSRFVITLPLGREVSGPSSRQKKIPPGVSSPQT